MKAGELSRYWPPQGSVSYFKREQDSQTQQLRTREIKINVLDVPFTRVRVLAEVCGEVRGRGRDTYVAYQFPPRTRDEVTLDTGKEQFGLTLLAALHRAEGFLVNLGVVQTPDEARESSLQLRDATGDGRPEILYFAGTGVKTAQVFVIWGWLEGRYRELYSGDLASDGSLEFKDLDGDSKPEMIIWEPIFGAKGPGGAWRGPFWPEVFRWDGRNFRRALIPAAYAEFIAKAKELRADAEGNADAEILLRLGHAYQLQGKTSEARAYYERAWRLEQAQPERHLPQEHCSPAEVVKGYYHRLSSGDLLSAYALLGEEKRRAWPFADFAAGFAQTLDVRLTEPLQVAEGPTETEVVRTPIVVNGRVVGETLAKVPVHTPEFATVAVRITAKDLTFTGEVEKRFAGTWRVRRHNCTLESSDIRPD